MTLDRYKSPIPVVRLAGSEQQLAGTARGWEYPTIALPDSERERVRAALGVGITDDRQLFAVFPGHTPGGQQRTTGVVISLAPIVVW
jgi:hypothetical protein